MKQDRIRRSLRRKSEVRKNRTTIMAVATVQELIARKKPEANVAEQSGSKGGHLDDES
jgi:hypothetical protein